MQILAQEDASAAYKQNVDRILNDGFHDLLSDLVRMASAMMRSSCQAERVSFWIDGHGVFRENFAKASEHEDRLGNELEVYIEARSRKTRELNDTSVCCHTAEGRDEFIFALLPLTNGARRIGAMGVAVPSEFWFQQGSTEALARVANVVAALFAQSLSKLELEKELKFAHQRSHELLRAAEIDALTKIENKASFEAKATARLAKSRRPAAMIALDLDDFKQVNDVYGHLFGDQLLKVTAEQLRTQFPEGSVIGRVGGDEFCVLLDLPEAGRSYLNSTIRRLRFALQRALATLGKPDIGGLSIGVSLYPAQAGTLEQLLNYADCALYTSKRMERNSTTIFSNELTGLLEAADRKSPDDMTRFSSITTFFQPIFDVETGQRNGLEFLARWSDRNGRISNPDSFMWMFRDHRFATNLTKHIVETGLKALQDAGVDLTVNPETLWINVTDNDLWNADFIFDMQALFNAYGVDWSNVVIEVSEDTLAGPKSGMFFNSLQEIRQRGGRVALDDFGAGQIGLAQVGYWPVDIVKIDRSIVQGIHASAQTGVVVEALVMVAKRLGLSVVAEGIETKDQMSAVKELGCSLAQGFALSRPSNAQDLLATPVETEAVAVELH